MTKTDTLFRADGASVKPFEFNEQVAEVFADMVQRSVPGYQMVVAMIGILAGQYAKPDTRIYDLGCSLGAMTVAMRPHVGEKNCTLVCVDNSAAMIARCKQAVERHLSLPPVEVVCDDIRNIPIENASFVVLNYSLQFIPVEERQSILAGIYAGMVPGAALVLSEKIVEATESDRQRMRALHDRFKKQNGYNDLEIAQKRAALENVLMPERLLTHTDRLHAVGFIQSIVWLKCLNFVSMLAFKPE